MFGWRLQELALVENLHHLLPGLTNISALADLHQLSLVKVTHLSTVND